MATAGRFWGVVGGTDALGVALSGGGPAAARGAAADGGTVVDGAGAGGTAISEEGSIGAGVSMATFGGAVRRRTIAACAEEAEGERVGLDGTSEPAALKLSAAAAGEISVATRRALAVAGMEVAAGEGAIET
ncbi:MAG: hypothetical protein EXS37_01820 [Opitutus sp.]|nr:hypothetical protein [Opitutus sp.]